MKCFLFILLLCQSLVAQQTVIQNAKLQNANIGQAVASGGVASTTFVISGVGSARHDFTAYLGYEFRPSFDITITDIGRMVLTGNSGSHPLYLCDASGNILVTATPVNTSGKPAGTPIFSSITPTALTHGVDYVVVSGETLNGDDWGSDDVSLTTTSDAVIGQSRYTVTIGTAFSTGTVGTFGYGPVNFKYTKP